MILNERILQVALSLTEELHFGRAAARLHISQPALSGTVKSLERDLGVCLFRRTSRHVELTEAGRVFAAEARRLLEEGELAVTRVRGGSPDILGPLRIGYSASADLRWLCSLISGARQSSGLAADLHFARNEAAHLHDALIKGTLHAAVFAGRLEHPDLKCVTLFSEPFSVVLAASHPLAESCGPTFRELAEEPVVWLRRDVDALHYDSFIASCASQGYRPKIAQEVRSFHECLEFARGGLGITFLPRFMRADGEDNSVVFVPLPEGAPHAEYRIASRGNRSESVDRFMEFAQYHALEKRRRNLSSALMDGK